MKTQAEVASGLGEGGEGGGGGGGGGGEDGEVASGAVAMLSSPASRYAKKPFQLRDLMNLVLL